MNLCKLHVYLATQVSHILMYSCLKLASLLRFQPFLISLFIHLLPQFIPRPTNYVLCELKPMEKLFKQNNYAISELCVQCLQ